MNNDILKIGTLELNSRLFTGTGKFASVDLMRDGLEASGSELITVAMKRTSGADDEYMLPHVPKRAHLLPNTSGVRNAKEAVFAAQLSREAFETNLLKLEIHPEPRHLMPDAVETLKATEELAKDGFVILPYIHADPVLCKQLENAGAAAVMPLGSPIGTNMGLETREFLRLIIEASKVPVVVDAGIGRPSHAMEAMEMGADAVLVNTAIATAADPVEMARCFAMAVEAGRRAYQAGTPEINSGAEASSPLTAFLS